MNLVIFFLLWYNFFTAYLSYCHSIFISLGFTMKKKNCSKRKYLFIVSSVVCAALLITAGIFICGKLSAPAEKNQHLRLADHQIRFRELSARLKKRQISNLLATSDYQSVFLSMYDISTFPTEAFTIYKGIPTLKPDYRLRNTEELNDVLGIVFSAGNDITNVFLGLDPFYFLRPSASPAEPAVLPENEWLTYVDANPDTSFDILFSFPSMDYWVSIPEADRSKALALYEQMVYVLSTRNNITMYYIGGEDWLICNPGNYTDFFIPNSQVAEKIFLHTFCDIHFTITAENASERLQQTRNMINAEAAAPTEYPDLSQYDIVFFGDSILGNYTGSLAIVDSIGSLSGASVFNCAQGGTCAAELSPGALCFPRLVAEFLAGQPQAPDTVYGQGILKYTSSDHSEKETCFLINFGLNDYFSGIALENTMEPGDILTYTGAIRTAIADLRKSYPDALYIIMGPGQVTIFNEGTDLRNEKNNLYDYAAAAAAVAKELDISYIDLYNSLPEGSDELTDVLLGDGVHYNEHGRFVLSRKIMTFIAGCRDSS